MNTIVIYTSGTGFTAKYAAWIAEELGCKATELKNVNLNELTNYDMVIYGGWLMAGMVSGYNKIKALNLKNVIVFGVGMSFPNEKITTTIAEQNQIPREKFYYFLGGYRPEQLGFFKRMMMNMIKKSIVKKADKTEEDLMMLKVFEGGDFTDREAIKPLLQQVNI